jgi:hypothetical protein
VLRVRRSAFSLWVRTMSGIRWSCPLCYDEAMRERAAERWWILEGGFRWAPPRGGSLYSGPYSTREDAFTARRKLEQILGHNSLFIEQEDAPARGNSRGD